jgi:hypothetical protein
MPAVEWNFFHWQPVVARIRLFGCLNNLLFKSEFFDHTFAFFCHSELSEEFQSGM